MTPSEFEHRLRSICEEVLPLPGSGDTALRHRRLMEIGREDLSLAKLAEAHWDALAILAEAGRRPQPGAVYGVWASEIPGRAVTVRTKTGVSYLSGSKAFCSGAGIVDLALVTAEKDDPIKDSPIKDSSGKNSLVLIEIDLRTQPGALEMDSSTWKTEAFALTRTSKITFHSFELNQDAEVGAPHWYTERTGFWHGACGPAACWAGGASGLLDFSMASKRNDPHTLAHLAAIYANIWALKTYMECAGHEIDHSPQDAAAARIRALTVRHLVEQASTDTLRRFARAYGPSPLTADADILRRYAELDVYLRQSHAERDLESLGQAVQFDS